MLFEYKENYNLSLFDKLYFIKEQIRNNNYVLLPNTIAINNVYKITYSGNLQNDGYELGFLYLPKGSGIINHTHTTDIEQYKLILGNLTVNGIVTNINRCMINESHNIDVVDTETFIETYKINYQKIKRR